MLLLYIKNSFESIIWKLLYLYKFQFQSSISQQTLIIIYNIRQKMANCTGPLPRNIRFNEQSIRNFVQGSSFLNSTNLIKENYNHENRIMAKTYNNFPTKIMGFDAYNKNNLLLKACNAEDIQYVQKNPLLFEEDVKIIPEFSRTTKNIETTHERQSIKAKTAKDFYKQPVQEPQVGKKSKEAELNEFLFNYRKQQEEKKNKKLKFLSEIQQRINSLEKQTFMLQSEKGKQYQQLNSILQTQNETTKLANKADLIGKLNSAIHEAEGHVKTNLSPPKKITQDMEFLQLNAVIQQQHNYNGALLEQIERISRSKSKERVKITKQQTSNNSPKKVGFKKSMDDFHPQQSSLSKTLKRPMQIPPRPSSSKKLTSTLKGKMKV